MRFRNVRVPEGINVDPIALTVLLIKLATEKRKRPPPNQGRW